MDDSEETQAPGDPDETQVPADPDATDPGPSPTYPGLGRTDGDGAVYPGLEGSGGVGGDDEVEEQAYDDETDPGDGSGVAGRYGGAIYPGLEASTPQEAAEPEPEPYPDEPEPEPYPDEPEPYPDEPAPEEAKAGTDEAAPASGGGGVRAGLAALRKPSGRVEAPEPGPRPSGRLAPEPARRPSQRVPAPEEPARRPSQRIGGPVDAPRSQAPAEPDQPPPDLASPELMARGERMLGVAYLGHALFGVIEARLQNPALEASGATTSGPCVTLFLLVMGGLLLINRGRILALVLNGLGVALLVVLSVAAGAVLPAAAGLLRLVALLGVVHLASVVALLMRPAFGAQHAVGLAGQVLLILASLYMAARPAKLLELSGMVVPVARGAVKAKSWRLKVGDGWYRLTMGKPPGDGDLLLRLPDGALLVVEHQAVDKRAARRLDPGDLLAKRLAALRLEGFEASPTRLTKLRENQRASAFKGTLKKQPVRGELLVTVGLEGCLVVIAQGPEKAWPAGEADIHTILASAELELEPADISDLLRKPGGGGGGSADPAAPAVDWGNPATVLARAASDDVGMRVAALEQWLARGHYKKPGARLAMLRALHSPRLTSDVEPAIVRSFEDPIECREALDCLPLVPAKLHDRLMRRLAEPDGTAPEAELAAALAQLPDTKELFVEESLIRLGQPRAGALQRLVDARGTEWARSAEGRALLKRVPGEELSALFSASREELRMLGVLLVGDRGGDLALDSLIQAILDPSPAVRQEAAGALERVQDPRIVMLLVRSYRLDQDEGTRARLRRALAAIALQDAVQALAERVADDDVEVRLDAVAGLELLPTPVGVIALSKALLDADAEVRKEALEALAVLRTSRAQGVADTLFASASEELRKVAIDSPDAEFRKAARHLFFQVRGRLPEQDTAQAKPRTGAAAQPAAEKARPQVIWADGGWQGQPDARYAFEADPRMADHALDARFRATVQAVNRVRGSTVELVGLRAWLEVRGAQGWKMEERPFELELTPHQRVVTSLGGGKYRVEDVRRTIRLDVAAFQEQVKDAVKGAIRNVRIREQGQRPR